LEPQRNPSTVQNRNYRSTNNIRRKKRVNEIPELKIAIISVSLANFEVNQITDKIKNIGREFAK
jgi:hypothetical protein